MDLQKRNWLSWRMVPAIVAGLLVGSILIQPAIAHIGSVGHLWTAHIKERVQGISGAYAAFDDTGPITATPTTIVSRSVPPGKYAIFAKVYFSGELNEVTCRLVAGSNFDEAQVDMGPGEIDKLSAALQVTNVFPTGGVPALRCNDNGGSGTITFHFAKLTAIEVPILNNTSG